MEMKKGDRIYFYTDGLFDIRLNDSKKIHKKEFFEDLADIITKDQTGADSDFIQGKTSAIVDSFFGKDRTNRTDDITIVVIEKS